MQITFTGHHLEVTDALRAITREKLDRLTRHFDRITSISVTFSVEHLTQKVDAIVHIPGATIHASADSKDDMYSAIDSLVNKLNVQLKKHKEKESDHHS